MRNPLPLSCLRKFPWGGGSVGRVVYSSRHNPFCFPQGIGDSGQGIVNAFLFCLLTPKVRQKLLTCFMHVLCCLWVCQKRTGHCSSCCYCCKNRDGYSTIRSMGTVDLQGSNSVSFPVLQSKVKRYSTCTVSTTSGSSDVGQELSPDLY